MPTSMYLRIYGTYLLQSLLVTTVQRIFFFSSHFILLSTAHRVGQSKTGFLFYGFVRALCLFYP